MTIQPPEAGASFINNGTFIVGAIDSVLIIDTDMDLSKGSISIVGEAEIRRATLTFGQDIITQGVLDLHDCVINGEESRWTNQGATI